jgi:hypothetical protein
MLDTIRKKIKLGDYGGREKKVRRKDGKKWEEEG